MVVGVARAFVVGAALAVAGAFVGATGRGHAHDHGKGEKFEHRRSDIDICAVVGIQK